MLGAGQVEVILGEEVHRHGGHQGIGLQDLLHCWRPKRLHLTSRWTQHLPLVLSLFLALLVRHLRL